MAPKADFVFQDDAGETLAINFSLVLARKPEMTRLLCLVMSGLVIDLTSLHDEVGYLMLGTYEPLAPNAKFASRRLAEIDLSLKLSDDPMIAWRHSEVPAEIGDMLGIGQQVWLMGWMNEPNAEWGTILHILAIAELSPRFTLTSDAQGASWLLDEYHRQHGPKH